MVWRPGKIEVPVEIVGVVEDVRQSRVAVPTYPEIFMDYRQVMAVHQRMGAPKQRLEQISFGFMSFGVRTHGDPRALIPRVRDIVRATDANATIDAIHPMEQMVGYSVARQKFYAVLLGTFAARRGTACRDRHLRGPCLFGGATHAGDWHPHGARRGARPGARRW